MWPAPSHTLSKSAKSCMVPRVTCARLWSHWMAGDDETPGQFDSDAQRERGQRRAPPSSAKSWQR